MDREAWKEKVRLVSPVEIEKLRKFFFVFNVPVT